MATALLAEEFAVLVTRPAWGKRSLFNATLAGLLLADLVLEGSLAPGTDPRQVIATSAPEPANPVLRTVRQVALDNGPNLTTILSAMDRGLTKGLGSGTWETASARQQSTQHEVLSRLQTATAGDQPLDLRTAALLSMTGPAHLLELVAPQRSTRKHARNRIDHCLDNTALSGIGEAVRKVLADAATAVAGGASAAAVTSC